MKELVVVGVVVKMTDWGQGAAQINGLVPLAGLKLMTHDGLPYQVDMVGSSHVWLSGVDGQPCWPVEHLTEAFKLGTMRVVTEQEYDAYFIKRDAEEDSFVLAEIAEQGTFFPTGGDMWAIRRLVEAGKIVKGDNDYVYVAPPVKIAETAEPTFEGMLSASLKLS
jgi:hypothetical protein